MMVVVRDQDVPHDGVAVFDVRVVQVWTDVFHNINRVCSVWQVQLEEWIRVGVVFCCWSTFLWGTTVSKALWSVLLLSGHPANQE